MAFWIFALFAGLVGYLAYEVIRKKQYWDKRGVPSLFPVPLVGHLFEVAWIGQGIFDQKWTKNLGRVFGYFDGPTPVLEVSDTEMLKHVLVKDFSHFVDRRVFTAVDGPVLSKGVIDLKGQHWKDVRGVLVPTFTSGKLRQMNSLIAECCQNMISNMDKMATAGTEYEAKELYGRVVMDIIASAFFGTKIDSQNDPNSEFVVNAKKAFEFSFASPIVALSFLFPRLVPLAVKLGITGGFGTSSMDFFVRNTEEIFRLRQTSKETRRDFLDLILKSLRAPSGTAKTAAAEGTQTYVKNADSNVSDATDVVTEGIYINSPEATPSSDYKLTMEEVVAQAILFFLAGYETTATTLSFLSYNLAINPDIQEKLRQEIVEKSDELAAADPNYDLMAQLPYLDQCVNETLRLFPPITRTERECTEDWEYKGTRVDKGSVIAVPIFAMQRDPEYWPDPEVFDPERFSYERKQQIKPYTFQTFGQGPRNCIGMRFAYYEIKMVMVAILKRFRIVPCARTEVPLKLKDNGFLYAKDGIWLKLEQL